jgi:hypothetical protein
VHAPTGLQAGFPEGFQPGFAVGAIPEDRLLMIDAGHRVVNPSSKLQAQRKRY